MTVHPGSTAAVAVGPDGRAVVVKTGTGGRADRLRHEAEVLAVANHAGVVELVALDERGDGGVSLTTAFAGVAAAVPAPDAATAVRLVAAVAATLADLHDRGVVHGRVGPGHVLLGASGNSVLCGFGAAARPGSGDGPPPGVDVVGLADFADLLFGDEPPGGTAAVRAVFGRVRAEDPGARPSMRALAAALAPLADEAPAGPRLLVARRRRRTPSASRRAARWGGPVLLGVVVAGLAWSQAGGDPHGAPPVDPVEPPSTRTTATVPATTIDPGTTTFPRPAAAPPACLAGGGADVDGDGCDEVVVVDGATVSWAGGRWSVGAPGEVAAVGDWDCDGRASAALLRPADGTVWVYPSWAEGEVAVPAGAVTGAVGLRAADPDADGCEALLLERRDGTTVLVEPPR